MSHELPTARTDAEWLATLGRRLRALRESAGSSQIEVAARTGLSRRTVARAEAGQNPTLATVIQLLRAYGRLAALDGFIPEPEISPMAVLRQTRRRDG